MKHGAQQSHSVGRRGRKLPLVLHHMFHVNLPIRRRSLQKCGFLGLRAPLWTRTGWDRLLKIFPSHLGLSCQVAKFGRWSNDMRRHESKICSNILGSSFTWAGVRTQDAQNLNILSHGHEVLILKVLSKFVYNFMRVIMRHTQINQ